MQAILSDTPPGIPHFQAQVIATPPGPQQDLALLGITTGVAEKIAQDPCHQPQVGADRVITDAPPQRQACRIGHRAELR
ncbi:hypothetical protein D3C79_660240 [compost metagenome]